MDETCETCRFWFGRGADGEVLTIEGYGLCAGEGRGKGMMSSETAWGDMRSRLWTQAYHGCKVWEAPDRYVPGAKVKVLKPQQGIIGPPFEWLPATIIAKVGRDDFANSEHYEVELADGSRIRRDTNTIRPLDRT